MPSDRPSFRQTLLFTAAVGVAFCTCVASASTESLVSMRSAALVALSVTSEALETWPLTPGTHPSPTKIAGSGGLNASGGIATDGLRIVIPNGNAIVVFDLKTKRRTTLPDPAGTPIDVAFSRSGAIYALNIAGNTGNVVVYPPQGKSREVTCRPLQVSQYIAVDNEGNAYVAQDAARFGVVEIPNGPNGLDGSRCTVLKLSPGVSGYVGGITFDPKTDDLLLLDDPDQCAGGIEGRLTTYRKPYGRASGPSLTLGQNCAGDLRLDATSSIVLIGDTSVDESGSFITEHTYPAGKPLGAFGGGLPGGFITISNS